MDVVKEVAVMVHLTLRVPPLVMSPELYFHIRYALIDPPAHSAGVFLVTPKAHSAFSGRSQVMVSSSALLMEAPDHDCMLADGMNNKLSGVDAFNCDNTSSIIPCLPISQSTYPLIFGPTSTFDMKFRN